jgi:hypothetical protein
MEVHNEILRLRHARLLNAERPIARFIDESAVWRPSIVERDAVLPPNLIGHFHNACELSLNQVHR